jgi:hypothetical protein
MALESVVLFIFTAIFFSLVPLMMAAIELKEVFFKFVILLLVYIALGAPLVYGIAWLEEEGKRELMLIVSLIFIPLFLAFFHFIALAILNRD